MIRWYTVQNNHYFATRPHRHLQRCVFWVMLLAEATFIAQGAQAQSLSSAMPDVKVAQVSSHSRKFPEKAGFGLLRITQPPEVLLDDKSARLAPGARIYGIDNLLQLSGTLVGKTLAVAYVKDSYGLLHQVWILTDAERKAASGTSS